jgi:hypothetical protein
VTSTPDRTRRRWLLRVLGAVSAVVGLLLAGVAIADLAGVFDRTVDVVDVAGSPSQVGVDDGPGLVWLFFLGLPLLFAGVWLVLLGSFGEEQAVRPALDTRACSSCGRTLDDDAAFCAACGHRQG